MSGFSDRCTECIDTAPAVARPSAAARYPWLDLTAACGVRAGRPNLERAARGGMMGDE